MAKGRKALRIAGAAVGTVATAAAAFVSFISIRGIPKYDPIHVDTKVEVTPERVAQGRVWANALCAGCHLDANTGALTGRKMSDAPPEFGPIYSRNITKDPEHGIGKWKDGELVVLLRTGLKPDGQYLPPYMAKLPHLSDEDLASIIAFLRSDDPLVAPTPVDPPGRTQPSFLTKFLSLVAFKPLPFPKGPIVAPPRTDQVAYGRYLTAGLDCFGCHSADFTKMDIMEPEKSAGYMGGGNKLLDLEGKEILSANITPDEETGIGRWSKEDFRRAYKTGFRPDKSVLRYPMVIHPDSTDEDADSIYAYLRTVPKIHNPVARKADVMPSGDPGAVAYHRYGCVSCHGEEGLGLADLRHASEHFKDDAALEAWIRDPASMKPGTRMPSWQGVIAEADYKPLMAHVRRLGVAPKRLD